MMYLKKIGKLFLCRLLERQVRQLRARHHFLIVSVSGSVGKTSTKAAIVQALQSSLRVRWQEGNYNDPLTVPLVLFGERLPDLFNAFAWFRLWLRNQYAISQPYEYDVVVVELGTDRPGEMQKFDYLEPDVAVVTAITPEHIAFFHTIDAVAEEELAVFNYAKKVLVNLDDTPAKYLPDKAYETYSLHSEATYRCTQRTPKDLSGQHVTFKLANRSIDLTLSILGEQGAKIALAAAAVADSLGIEADKIRLSLAEFHSFPGRMMILKGIQGAAIIDDTYNSSPVAAKAALDVLYSVKTPQRIAILGSMNELGSYSEEAHRDVGRYCHPDKLDLLITIGDEAQRYLAPAAVERGCQVKTFLAPRVAGLFLASYLKKNAVILAKGSQNGVFAEEAIKPLLADSGESNKLVRQSSYWLKEKAKQFKG